MKRAIIITLVLASVALVFTACSAKGNGKNVTTKTTESAWVDESLTNTSETTTESTTEPNTQPETPVDATEATEGTTKAPVVEKTTKTPKPNTTQAPKPTNPPAPPAPAPIPTTPPTSEPAPTEPVPSEITEEMKDSILREVFGYAQFLGYPTVWANQMGDCQGEYAEMTPENYRECVELMKAMLYEFYTTGYKNQRVNVQWSEKYPNRLYVHTK